jgi:hypothetical protein
VSLASERVVSAEFFDVRPRYTSGSPAAVPEHIAREVAKQEKDAYEAALTGMYGEEYRRLAQAKGMDGVAIYMKETRTGWLVFDLITFAWSEWPFVATCPTCKRKKVRCNRGVLEDHGPTYTNYAYTCSGSRTYVGRDVTDTDQYRGKTL